MEEWELQNGRHLYYLSDMQWAFNAFVNKTTKIRYRNVFFYISIHFFNTIFTIISNSSKK